MEEEKNNFLVTFRKRNGDVTETKKNMDAKKSPKQSGSDRNRLSERISTTGTDTYGDILVLTRGGRGSLVSEKRLRVNCPGKFQCIKSSQRPLTQTIEGMRKGKKKEGEPHEQRDKVMNWGRLNLEDWQTSMIGDIELRHGVKKEGVES